MIEWRINHIEETDSTNNLARSGKHGDVFSADFQSAGRGRLDHKWISPKGENLMMSAVLDVAGIEAQEVATFPLVAGLAVAQALKEFSLPLSIKWPNDILVGGKKLAGILCEKNADNVIVGIGVNVLEKSFPCEIAARATSLALLGVKLQVSEVRAKILSSLGSLYGVWRDGAFASLWPRFVTLDYLKGREIAIFEQDTAAPSASGICGGIAPNGALLVNGAEVWSGEAHVKII